MVEIVKILDGRGRIPLVDLARWLFPKPGIEEEDFDGEECDEDCDECEDDDDDEEWVRCRLKGALLGNVGD